MQRINPSVTADFGGAGLPHQFWRRTMPLENGCWAWIGSCFDHGYGSFSVKGKRTLAHRAAYASVASVTEGLVLDHLCRNRWCVNPSHLEEVTVAENILRGTGRAALNARKDFCGRGHALSEHVVNSSGERYCQTCRSSTQKAYYRANRERVLARQKAHYLRNRDRRREYFKSRRTQIGASK